MITFEESTHTYTTEMGRVIPSVSEVVGEILGDQYSSVPRHILEAAAQFGTDVHSAIEMYNLTGLVDQNAPGNQLGCLEEYIKLLVKHDIKPLKNEVMVHYKHIYAGTFDLIAHQGGQLALIDYKTTAQLNEDWLLWQLNLYRLAYESMTEDKIERLTGIWLPKGKLGKAVEVPIIFDDQLILTMEEALRGIDARSN